MAQAGSGGEYQLVVLHSPLACRWAGASVHAGHAGRDRKLTNDQQGMHAHLMAVQDSLVLLSVGLLQSPLQPGHLLSQPKTFSSSVFMHVHMTGHLPTVVADPSICPVLLRAGGSPVLTCSKTCSNICNMHGTCMPQYALLPQ